MAHAVEAAVSNESARHFDMALPRNGPYASPLKDLAASSSSVQLPVMTRALQQRSMPAQRIWRTKIGE